MALRESELRADLRRFYGLSLDAAGEGYSWRDLAAMCAHLPSESAVRRAGGDGWSEAERLLAMIADNTYKVWWQRVDHTDPELACVKEVVPPSRRGAAREADDYTEADMADIADRLGIPDERR